MMGNVMYIVGSLSGAAAAYLLIATLRKPMVYVLREVCGGAERAELWRRLIFVEITTVALVLSMLGASPDDYSRTSGGAEHVWLVLKQVRWGLLGFVFSLPVVGFGIASLIPAYERRKGAPPDEKR